jgi:hypothetical protein
MRALHKSIQEATMQKSRTHTAQRQAAIHFVCNEQAVRNVKFN